MFVRAAPRHGGEGQTLETKERARVCETAPYTQGTRL